MGDLLFQFFFDCLQFSGFLFSFLWVIEQRIMVVSLLELCVRSAIDNLQYISDVGETDIQLLKRILPHCNAEQLNHIESSTKGRDLSPITDDLWRKCYGRKFGNDAVEMVKERMSDRKCKFKWRQLYQAKCREQDEIQRKGVSRLRELYKEQNSQKERKQIVPIDLKPPESKRIKRTGPGGSSGPSSKAPAKGRLMQKARMEFAKSNAASRQASMAKSRLNLNNGINQRPGGSFRR
uniref:Elongin-A n=2 Tax=Physcomitrium patens TaxID=3218 RepID=A0A7I4FGW4_PHYPA